MQKQSDMDDVKQPYKPTHAMSKASCLDISFIKPICLSGYIRKPAIQEEMASDADGQSATRPDEASSSSQSDSGQSATDRQQAETSTSQVSCSSSFVCCYACIAVMCSAAMMGIVTWLCNQCIGSFIIFYHFLLSSVSTR